MLLIKQSWIYLVILYPTKLYNAMIEIYHGLITKSNPLYTKNAVFKKFCCDRNNSLMKKQRNILQDCSVLRLTLPNKNITLE